MANCSNNNNAHAVQCCLALIMVMVLMMANLVTGETLQVEIPPLSHHKIDHSHTRISTTNNPHSKPILNRSMMKELQSLFPGSFNGAANQGGTYKKVQYIFERNMLHGIKARVNIWNPHVLDGEASMTWLSVHAGTGDQLSTIQTGWMVAPSIFGDNKTRLYIYWTNDGGSSTGCYNLRCPGFFLSDRGYDFENRPLERVSAYDGEQHYVDMEIKKSYHRWDLLIDGSRVGFWPKHIFTVMAEAATSCSWGAQVYDSHSTDHPTTTQMGSGHFPEEGAKKAAIFSYLEYTNIHYIRSPVPTFLNVSEVTHPGCYRVSNPFKRDHALHFYYGGPGGQSPTCTF